MASQASFSAPVILSRAITICYFAISFAKQTQLRKLDVLYIIVTEYNETILDVKIEV